MTNTINPIEKMINIIIKALEDVKAKDITIIDTNAYNSLFSKIVIATGNSTTQVKALGKNVGEKLRTSGFDVIGMEGFQNSEWVLVDAGDVIIHAMQPHIRAFYDIETLWGAEQNQPLLKTANL